jgi:PEP-CTERM motif
VNSADYDLWRANYGAAIGSSATGVAAIPEPAALWLVCFGAASISLNRRKPSIKV